MLMWRNYWGIESDISEKIHNKSGHSGGSILVFFEMQIKSLFLNSIELLQASFGELPKTFVAVNI
jgi:hypothetical protein